MELATSDRGFNYTRFEDKYKQKCSLQESSAADQPCIWLGVDVDLNGKECNRMHLTQDMVKALLPYLEEFVMTGNL